MILNWLLPAIAIAILAVMMLPPVRHWALWRATITPLASIIGSGFLVSGPLLTHVVGQMAPLAMAGILFVAYGIGAVIRFNIIHGEPVLEKDNPPVLLTVLERMSDLALGLAYIVSVAFYIRLLASFVLRMSPFHGTVVENALTTLVLLFIALVGWFRGLNGLEKVEGVAVTIKLAIIAALLLGLGSFDIGWMASDKSLPLFHASFTAVEQLQLLAGMILIVQGFETSSYLGNAYDSAIRVRSMKLAQWIAASIYMLFIALGLPLLMDFHGHVDDTTIVGVAQHISLVLPFMIIVAAAMSQFSAAIADTLGAGGLFSSVSGGKFNPRVGYVCLIAAATALVWTANVFEIITLASRFFATYYLLQCLVAMWVCSRNRSDAPSRYLMRMVAFSVMAATLLFVILFAKSVE